MKDQELQESTASESLSLKEEFEMCESWLSDSDSSSLNSYLFPFFLFFLFSLFENKKHQNEHPNDGWSSISLIFF